MTITELEQSLKPGTLLSLVGSNTKKVGVDEWRVNPCPICGHKDHFTIYNRTNSYSSFNSCTKGGGVYRYLIDIKNLSEDQARDRLKELAGYDYIKEAPAVVEGTAPEQEIPLDYTPMIIKLYETVSNDTTYLKERGISQKLIEKYKLSVTKEHDGRRAMLPIWKNGKVIFYTQRALDGQNPRYKNAKGKAQLFNIDTLEQAGTGDIVIITEGIIDALTLEDLIELKTVALGGTEHYNKVKEDVEAAQQRGAIILTAFDNDEAGRNAAKGAGLPRVEICKPYKDINEWKVKEPAEAHRGVVNAIKGAKQTAVGDISNYLSNKYLSEIDENRNIKRLETSIASLDTSLNGGLYPGLHILGGEPGVGKTALAMQIADKIAMQGREILYISLEMSKYELITRSISRIAYSKGNDRTMLTGALLNGEIEDELVEMYLKEYQAIVGDKLIVKQGDFNLTVDDILKEAQRIKAFRGQAPAIIVDYLQILQGTDGRKDIRLQIDDNIVALKRMSRDLNTPVILISSLNRNGQNNIGMASFKESGGIEYSADSLMALVYDRDTIGANTEPGEFFSFNGYYPIEIHILKNRRGMKGKKIKLEWEPAFNYFHLPIRNTTRRSSVDKRL